MTDHVERGELVKSDGVDASYDRFVEQGLEVLAGLRPRLLKDVQRLPGARILAGKFTAVQQTIGTKPDRPLAATFLQDFVEEAKASGLVQQLIDRHGVQGQLTVPPTADRNGQCSVKERTLYSAAK